MAIDVGETVRDALGNAVREALKNVGDASPAPKKKSGPFSGAKGLAAGAGLAAAAPLAKKGVDAFRNGGLPSPSAGGAVSKVTDKLGSSVKDAVSGKVEDAGGAGNIAKEAASGLIPGLGGDGDSGGKGGMPGVGKGRRMPVQQSIDVAVPLETAYNQWTQFEDWPEFMHRVTRVTQDDDCSVGFATKIWGKTKEFKATIETQRPDERIKWKVSEGITHSGVVSFHELAPNLTRIELNIDVDPGSLIEKAARGMRHVKRAVRADLHRFKAFIEMQEMETGAWRGVIEDGELVEPHDESYDEERDYSEVDDLMEDEDSSASSDEDDDDDDDGSDEEQEHNGNGGSSERSKRFERQAKASRSRSAAASSSSPSRTAGSSKSGSSKSGSSRSGSSSKSGSSSSRSRPSSKSGSSSKGSSSGGSSSKSGSSSSRSRPSSKSGSSKSSGSSSKSSGSSAKSSGRSRSSASGSGGGSGARKSGGQSSSSSGRSRSGGSGSGSSAKRSSSSSSSSRRKAGSRS
jgi:uncharacterized membrane protein